MDVIRADIAVIGAGIAGAGAAADLAEDHSVVILELEDRPGYHSTGRSVAVFIQNYGNDTIRALNRLSAPLFRSPDPALFASSLLTPRGIVNVFNAGGLDEHKELLAASVGLQEISVEEAAARFPLLRRDAFVAASYEPDASDIDVATLHQAWLRKAGQHGAQLLTNAPVQGAERKAGHWHIATPKARVVASTVVNAAGAWADQVAQAFGVPPVGLQPMRRSIAVVAPPDGADVRHWPLIGDGAESWYCKPEAGRLLVSPAEEIPVEPHDAFVDELILAEGVDRFERAMTFPVTRVERSWAGLRTFAPDRTPVAGFNDAAERFFWLAGQGGYGIQTSPALSRFAGQSIRQAGLDEAFEPLQAALSPTRFRS